jgi:hypothetical protein
VAGDHSEKSMSEFATYRVGFFRLLVKPSFTARDNSPSLEDPHRRSLRQHLSFAHSLSLKVLQDLRLRQKPVSQIGGNPFHVPPVEGNAHDLAARVDAEIRGSLNRSKKTVSPCDGGSEKLVIGGKAEVEPSGRVPSLLCD